MRGEPRGPRARSVGSIAQRGRALLDAPTAYDYAFRASLHPSAAAARAHARGTITYDRTEAEPLPQFQPAQLGDCVDCTICVQVCPTGIDIRNGLQYECIACGACIDGCNEVMDKLGYEHGLIRYTTQNAIDGKASRVVRPRIVVYGTLLALLGVDKWRMKAPVKHGDTIHVQSKVIEKRDSGSRPEAGIVTFDRKFINQRGETAQEMQVTILYRRRTPLS